MQTPPVGPDSVLSGRHPTPAAIPRVDAGAYLTKPATVLVRTRSFAKSALCSPLRVVLVRYPPVESEPLPTALALLSEVLPAGVPRRVPGVR
jgi:hypothetical protein